MKFILYNLDSKINQSLSLVCTQTLTIAEQEILELQDLFLCPGVHSIFASSCKEGRSMIYTFLSALRCYNAVGCFTNLCAPLKKDIFDIQGYLEACGYLDEKKSSDLDRFFIEEFEFDFIWIEQKKSDSRSLFFEQKLREFGIDQQIPILILSVDA